MVGTSRSSRFHGRADEPIRNAGTWSSIAAGVRPRLARLATSRCMFVTYALEGPLLIRFQSSATITPVTVAAMAYAPSAATTPIRSRRREIRIRSGAARAGAALPATSPAKNAKPSASGSSHDISVS